MGWILGEKALGFLEEEFDLGKRLVADVLPADEALPVDEEGAVQWLLLEVVVGAILLEDFNEASETRGKGNGELVLFC
ncbi:MAG: hypothetical protein Ct9H300mP32_4720 [Verrucomicrobiota bacterium]|nr:MAG: hypothetical protein Ct9H300mP32_4720 [Verrucomicrobiota bacterium]